MMYRRTEQRRRLREKEIERIWEIWRGEGQKSQKKKRRNKNMKVNKQEKI